LKVIDHITAIAQVPFTVLRQRPKYMHNRNVASSLFFFFTAPSLNVHPMPTAAWSDFMRHPVAAPFVLSSDCFAVIDAVYMANHTGEDMNALEDFFASWAAGLRKKKNSKSA
jgi:hypothetical protein